MNEEGNKLSLIYGFTVPGKVWNSIVKEEPNIEINIFNEMTEIEKIWNCEYKFKIVSFNNDNSDIVIGLNITNIDDKIYKLPINEVNLYLNNNINNLQQLFGNVFKHIITVWAKIIKNLADEITEKYQEKVPEDIIKSIDIPNDLRVEWYICESF